jgi:hypothetical protein
VSEVDRHLLPRLPDNQRWQVSGYILNHIIVRLQERRWWGWRTIADHTAPASWGSLAVSECVRMIEQRDYIARIMADAEAERKRRRAEIPRGTFRGGRS